MEHLLHLVEVKHFDSEHIRLINVSHMHVEPSGPPCMRLVECRHQVGGGWYMRHK